MSKNDAPVLSGLDGFVLSGDRDQFEAVAEGRASGADDAAPARRFRKDLIAVGTYRHPVHGWTLSVTRSRLRQWLSAFEMMKRHGVDIEVTVDHQSSAGAVQGYLVDMFIEDDRLFGIHEMIGDAAIDLAQRVKNVSIEIEPTFVDGRGVRYGEAIVRSSLVQQPVVPDQQAFVPIAASRSGDARRGPMFVLATEHGANHMQFLSDLAAILGHDDSDGHSHELTESNWQDALRQRIAQGEQQLTEARQKLSLADERADALSAQLAQPANSAVDAEVLEELAESAGVKLSRLVEQGCITPAVRDRLETLLIGANQQRPAVLLSRTAAQAAGMAQPLARQVLEALALNDTVQLGEQTRAQSIALSRHTPGGSDAGVDSQTQQRMSAAAYGAR